MAVRDDADTEHHVDRVVLATHADQALALLADPTPAEREVLGAFAYSRNETWLHTDASLLPAHPRRGRVVELPQAGLRRARTGCCVSYDMNRLMRLADARPYVVTLERDRPRAPDDGAGADGLRAPGLHPGVGRRAAPAAGDRGATRTAFAGAYHGWGFHEDGCAAGVRAAARVRGGLVTNARNGSADGTVYEPG